MTFKDLKGIEGIDKLNDCIPFVEDIMSDRKLFEENIEKSWLQMAVPVYKAHTESIEKLMEILEEKAESSADILMFTTKIISSLFMDESIRNFFIVSCKSMMNTVSAMASTMDEQSVDSSDTVQPE